MPKTLSPESEVDFLLTNHGSIFILTPLSSAGSEWIDDNIGDDAQTWGKDSIVIEHRYVSDIVNGASNDGLTFRQ